MVKRTDPTSISCARVQARGTSSTPDTCSAGRSPRSPAAFHLRSALKLHGAAIDSILLLTFGFVCSLCSAFCEEVIFRGLLQRASFAGMAPPVRSQVVDLRNDERGTRMVDLAIAVCPSGYACLRDLQFVCGAIAENMGTSTNCADSSYLGLSGLHTVSLLASSAGRCSRIWAGCRWTRHPNSEVGRHCD